MKTIAYILTVLLIATGIIAHLIIQRQQVKNDELRNEVAKSEATIKHQRELIEVFNIQIQLSKDSISKLNEQTQQVKYIYIEKEKELELLEPEEQIAKFDENTGDYKPTKLIEDSLALTPLPRIKNANRAFLSNVYLSERVDIKSALIVQYELAMQLYEDKIAAGDEIQKEQSKIIELKDQIIENMESKCRKKRIISYAVAGGVIILVLLL